MTDVNIHDAYTDSGSVLPKGEAAITTINGMTDFELLLPKFNNEDVLPEAVSYLVACLLRHQDDEFRNEMLEWMEEQK
jgi:hypothetical protein